jgi:nucleotide-binding universal stress UspA family protein
MIKDLLLVISDNAEQPAAQDYAASLAAAHDAHLAGAAIVHDLVVPGTVFDAAAAGLLAEFRAQSEAAAAKNIAKFEEKCRREGLKSEAFTLDARTIGAGEMLALTARRYDLTVVRQSAPDEDGGSQVLAEAALFNSGRPVLIVPYAYDKPFKLDRVCVAWDGGARAARALSDAMPFLTRAKQVEIITVTPDTKDIEVPGAGIARHLARHGVDVALKNLIADKTSIAAKILSNATSEGADLLVMGGYGHSRLRQFVLGGVTRDILASTNVPTLMSH